MVFVYYFCNLCFLPIKFATNFVANLTFSDFYYWNFHYMLRLTVIMYVNFSFYCLNQEISQIVVLVSDAIYVGSPIRYYIYLNLFLEDTVLDSKRRWFRMSIFSLIWNALSNIHSHGEKLYLEFFLQNSKFNNDRKNQVLID